MTAQVAIYDESTAGEKNAALMVELPGPHISVRELIEIRIKQEVERYNNYKRDNKPPLFNGLVQPTGTEEELNGYRFKQDKTVDWSKQYDAAIKAFKANRIIILADNRQVESLDQELEMGQISEVSFLKLVPLVGG